MAVSPQAKFLAPVVGARDIEKVAQGNYEAQRQLGHRLEGNSLRVVSALDHPFTEERDFELAAMRRDEPEGASLVELGTKYGLR